MDKTTKTINLDELKEMVISEKVCFTCKYASWVEPGLYACTNSVSPAKTIDQFKLKIFGCNQWQKRDDNQNC